MLCLLSNRINACTYCAENLRHAQVVANYLVFAQLEHHRSLNVVSTALRHKCTWSSIFAMRSTANLNSEARVRIVNAMVPNGLHLCAQIVRDGYHADQFLKNPLGCVTCIKGEQRKKLVWLQTVPGFGKRRDGVFFCQLIHAGKIKISICNGWV